MSGRAHRLLGLLTLLTIGVHAQVLAAPTKGGDLSSHRLSLWDVTPNSTVLTSEIMEEFGIGNRTDLQERLTAFLLLPYDAAARGVGRNFRNLGGDPGVATYINGVYSEDLYTATIGNFWDMERIEAARGPQGTAYGRNSPGGAIKFVYRKPTNDLETMLRAVVGNYNTTEFYGAVSGPIVKDRLAGRVTASIRDHDGYIEEKGFGSDPDDGGENSFALALRFTPRDDMELNARVSKADVDRVIGGADRGGLVLLRGESFDGDDRDFSNLVLGYRQIDRAQVDPTARDFFDPTAQVFEFTNPSTSEIIEAQNLRAGVDSAFAHGRPNQGFGLTTPTRRCLILNKDTIEGNDSCATTNGHNSEQFDQTGVQADYTWRIMDRLTLKYIFGYSDLTYERVTDDDSVASLDRDRQFYLNHEANYQSHELQASWYVDERVRLTSGVFFYDAEIDQRGDFYSSVGESQYVEVIDPLNLSATFFPNPQVSLFDARNAGTSLLIGQWVGDPTPTNVPGGPGTIGTDLAYAASTDRNAFAVYTQAVWHIEDKYSLTAGVRYSNDDLEGEENLARYSEDHAVLASAQPAPLTLAQYNVIRGALDPVTLSSTGGPPVYTTGVPFSSSMFRALSRSDDELTYRLRLDYAIFDNHAIYGGVSTGHRPGGYNLGFFSQTAEYGPEDQITLELGWRGRFRDDTLELTALTFYSQYNDVQTVASEVTSSGDTREAVLEAPKAWMLGFESEAVSRPTDRITLGYSLGFSHGEFSESVWMINDADPRVPPSLFTPQDRSQNIDGHTMPLTPRHQGWLFISYRWPLVRAGTLDILGMGGWVDDVHHSPFQAAEDRAAGYSRIRVRLTWTSPNESWVITGFASNFRDRQGISQLSRYGETEGFRRTGQLTEPRTWGLEATYRWGG